MLPGMFLHCGLKGYLFFIAWNCRIPNLKAHPVQRPTTILVLAAHWSIKHTPKILWQIPVKFIVVHVRFFWKKPNPKTFHYFSLDLSLIQLKQINSAALNKLQYILWNDITIKWALFLLSKWECFLEGIINPRGTFLVSRMAVLWVQDNMLNL